MIREKVLGMGVDSATLLVKDTQSNDKLRILRRVSLLGWTEGDVSNARELYSRLHKLKLPGIVAIDTILVQGSFLNVVTDFCVGGDLNTYLEDKLAQPLPENQVVQWLLSISLALRSLHCDAHCPFYGLSLERVFFGNTGGMLLGLPLPPFLYFKQIMDRRNERVVLEKEYPPEAIQKKLYHPNLSDVWHLGLIMQKLLSAQTQFSLRSSAIQQLLIHMMKPELECRIPLDEVIRSLQHIIGDTKPSEHPPLDLNIHAHGNKAAVRDRVVSPTLLQAVAPDMKETQSTSKEYPLAPHVLNNSSASRGFTLSMRERTDAEQQRQIHSALLAAPESTKMRQGINNNDDTHEVSAHQENARAPQDSWHLRAMKQFEELQRMNTISPARMNNQTDPQNGSAGRSCRGLTTRPINASRGYGAPKQFSTFLEDSFSADEVANHNRQKNIRRHIKNWNQKRIEEIALNANQHNNLVVTDCSSVVIVAPRTAGLPASQKGQLTPRAAANSKRAGSKTPNPTLRVEDSNGKARMNDRMVKTPSPTKAFLDRRANIVLQKEGDQVQQHPSILSSIQPDNIIIRTPSTISSSSVAKLPPREPPRRMGAKYTDSDRPRSPPAVPLSRVDSSQLAKASLHSSISGIGSCPSASEVSSRKQDVSIKDQRSPQELPSQLVSGMGRPVSLSSPSEGAVVDAQILTTLEWTLNGLRSVLRNLLQDHSLYNEVMTAVLSFVTSGQEGCLNSQRNEVFLYQLKRMIPSETLFMTVASLCAQFAALERLSQSAKGQRHFLGSGKEKVNK